MTASSSSKPAKLMRGFASVVLSVTLTAVPSVLADALQATLALTPSSEGQKTTQREIATAMIAVGSFHIEEKPRRFAGELEGGVVAYVPHVAREHVSIVDRPAGYQTEIPFIAI